MSDRGLREQTAAILREHSGTFVDQDGDTRCECGKWLEPGEHEWDWHVSALVVEALGLTEEWAHQGQPYDDAAVELDEWSCGHIIITPTRFGRVHEDFDTPVRRWVSGWSVVGETKP